MMDRPSPYVGPRAFEKGDSPRFHGRDQEARELVRLLAAERIVVLYSPSGAGKTSLIQAGLDSELGRLPGDGFQVLPPARVSGKADRPVATTSVNPYVASLVGYWEEGRPADVPALTDLGDISLDSYLTQRSWIRGDPRPTLIVLDQFEELLTQNPRDQPAKQEFLRQLGVALQNRERWALIAMREEHIAGLDPYLDLLPTRLGTRYRLELLTHEQAKEAIARPATPLDLRFDPEALQRLIDELTLVRESDGTTYHTAYVEPLHLQVVCDRLWKGLPDGTQQVAAGMIDTAGTVNEALAAYYRDAIQAVARSPAAVAAGCKERQIRDWLEAKLITPGGLRDQVHEGRSATEGLPNAVVKHLEGHYLLRSELRRGTLWYEIAHDRLVDAIQEDNRAWYQAQSEPLRILHRHLVEPTGHAAAGGATKQEAAVLTGRDLSLVEAWAEENPAALTDADRALIADSLERCRKERDRARLRKGLWLTIALTGLVAMLAASTLWRMNAVLEQRNLDLADSRDKLGQMYLELAQKSLQLSDTATQVRIHRLLSDASQARWRLNDHGLAALLTLQAERFSRRLGSSAEAGAKIENSLRGIVQLRPFALGPRLPEATRPAAGYGAVAFAPDAQSVAAQVADTELAVFSLGSTRQDCPPPRLRVDGAVRQIEFTDSGQYLIVVTDKGLEVFPAGMLGCSGTTDGPHTSPSRVVTGRPPLGPLCTAANETSLFVAVEGGGIERWPMTGGVLGKSGRPIGQQGGIARGGVLATAIACDPSGQWVALGDEKGLVQVTPLPRIGSGASWSVVNDDKGWPDEVKAQLGWAKAWLDLGVSALIPWVERQSLIVVFRHGPVALLPLQSAGAPGTAHLTYLRPTRDSEAELRVRAALGGASRDLVRKPRVLRATFDPGARRLVVGGERAVGVWRLDRLYRDPDAGSDLGAQEPWDGAVHARYDELLAPHGGVAALRLLDRGEAIIAADAEMNIRLWLLQGLGRIGYASTDAGPGTAGAPPAGVLYSLGLVAQGSGLAVGASRHLSLLRLELEPPGLALGRTRGTSCVSGSFRSMASSPDGRWLAIVTHKHQEARGCRPRHDRSPNAVWVVDAATGAEAIDPVDELEIPDGGWAVAWGAVPPLLAAGDYSGNLWVWLIDPGTGRPRQGSARQLHKYPSPVRALAFHPSEPWLAVGTGDGTIDILRITVDAEGQVARNRVANPDWIRRGAVRALAFSPEGKTLTFGNDDGLLGIVPTQDLPSGVWKTSQTLFAHSAGVAALAFCGAGAGPREPASGGAGCSPGLLASAGNDGRVWLWKVAQQGNGPHLRRIKSFDGPTAEAVSVAFTADGGHVVAGDARGAVHLWRIETGPVIDATCAALRSNLAGEEWVNYVGEEVAYECTCPNLPPGPDVREEMLREAVDCHAPRSTAP